ncbi:MAG: MgtC/SapB family protein [Anaerolineae bacterium]
MTPWWEILVRLLLAALIGGVIGWEREAAGKPAGFRTLTLVSLAACLYLMASQLAAERAGEAADSVRAMAGIVQGIGFLGAGIILRSQGEVRWLTTAASVWATAALGMAAGMGIYLIAVAGAILVFVTLRWLHPIEARIRPPRAPRKPKSREDADD